MPAPVDAHRLASVFQQLLGEHGLTERNSSFARGDIVRELAFALGEAPDSETLLAATDSFLRLEQIVPLDRQRFTTRSMQAAELRITELAQRHAPPQLILTHAQADEGVSRVETQRGFALSDEQRQLVRGVTADAGSVSLVRAVAGSGKTTTLAAIAQAYTNAGIPVHGVAPTGAAVRVMTEAGIPSRTVDRALLDREQALRAGIRPTPGVVLVDEASTIGTYALARLAEAVAFAGAKLVLVGDEAQIPPVPAGTSYANLLQRERPVHALETPRRFITPDGKLDLAEADALASLRAGTLEGTGAYLNHKRDTGAIRVLERSEALAAATAWHARHIALGADPARIALIARSNELRKLLNRHARDSMRTAGCRANDAPLSILEPFVAYLITTDLKLPHLLRHSFKPRALSLRQLSTVEPNRAVRPADAPDNRAASWNYDIYADKAGKYRWRALSSNGQNVGSGGESFSSKSSAQTAADNVKTKAGGATGP